MTIYRLVCVRCQQQTRVRSWWPQPVRRHLVARFQRAHRDATVRVYSERLVAQKTALLLADAERTLAAARQQEGEQA